MPETSAPLAITADDVDAAARRIAGAAIRTPLLENAVLNEKAGGRVLVKFEGAQHAGSFKFRGAYNRLACIPVDVRRAGVVAWSSGNHAQGVAAAALRLGIAAMIVMPSDAPLVKIENTRKLGAEVTFYDRYTESREAIATALAAERGAALVPSFDDPLVIAGQGTVGLEIAQQSEALGAKVDQLLVCCGGGGLVAGIAMAFGKFSPATAIYSVEPTAFDDTARSLRSGQREVVSPDARSICDALLTPQPGKLTFPINRQLLAGGLAVTDDEVRAAMRFAFSELKLVVEPGGAVALAAVLTGKIPTRSRTTGVVISGANVDPDLFAKVITETSAD